MPLPRGLARFNRHVTNRITTPFARRFAGFGVIHHVGRISGNSYETPVNCWVSEGTVAIPLTYGPEVDWLQNLTAAGGGEIELKGKRLRIGPPTKIDPAEGRKRIPAWVALALGILDVSEFREFPVLTA